MKYACQRSNDSSSMTSMTIKAPEEREVDTSIQISYEVVASLRSFCAVQMSFYGITADYNGPPKQVNAHTDGDGYDMGESGPDRTSQISYEVEKFKFKAGVIFYHLFGFLPSNWYDSFNEDTSERT